MAQRKKPAARRPWRSVVVVAGTLVGVTAVVLALNQAGAEALRRVGGRDRYRTPFADISCDTPPGLDRPTFLAEVRYVGGLPDRVNALDPADRDRLTAGFVKHPWVEVVDGVIAEPGSVVRVALRFRTPVLAATTTAGTTRLLDARGVLLPVTPTPTGVAELVGAVPPPQVAAGEVWEEPTVVAALRLVGSYHPARLEKSADGWRLTAPDGKLYAVRP
ncbi:MAG TPA: hypothetical protein VH092_20695 [Urbifossiella sp.]|nr:hypothetical protein [Urbifossiella sp.]